MSIRSRIANIGPTLKVGLKSAPKAVRTGVPNTLRQLRTDFGAMLKDPRRRGVALSLVGLFVVLCVAAILLGGQRVPSDSVAVVNDSPITRAEFNHWLNAAAHSQQSGGPVTTPDPPTFAGCVAAKRAQPPPPGQPPPSDTDLLNQCRSDYETFKNQALQFLITAQWVQQEADREGIHPSDSEINQQFQAQKAQAFPDQNAYQQFLSTSGQTEQDLLLHVKLSILENNIRQKIVSGANVTDSDISNYYNHNRQQFSQPPRRDIQVIYTHDQNTAQQARQALDSGQDFKAVATQFSADKSAADTGGNLPDVTPGQQEKPLNDAIFSAPQGQVQGPVQTQFGWYVFKVNNIKPASNTPLPAARDMIRNTLQGQKQQQALVAFVQNFQNSYRGQTQCATGYITASCANGPKPPPVTAPAGSSGG